MFVVQSLQGPAAAVFNPDASSSQMAGMHALSVDPQPVSHAASAAVGAQPRTAHAVSTHACTPAAVGAQARTAAALSTQAHSPAAVGAQTQSAPAGIAQPFSSSAGTAQAHSTSPSTTQPGSAPNSSAASLHADGPNETDTQQHIQQHSTEAGSEDEGEACMVGSCCRCCLCLKCACMHMKCAARGFFGQTRVAGRAACARHISMLTRLTRAPLCLFPCACTLEFCLVCLQMMTLPRPALQ